MTLYTIGEDGFDKSIVVDNHSPGHHLTRLYFVGNEETSWSLIKRLYGECSKCGDDEWKFHENIAPTSNLDFKRGNLHYIDLPTELTHEMVYNSSGLGIACLYTSLGKSTMSLFTELTHRQQSSSKNVYGWLRIFTSVGQDGNLHCTPANIIEYDRERTSPTLRAVAYDIEMVHAIDSCNHDKCKNLGYCHEVPDASQRKEFSDYINILTGIMWNVSTNPEIVSKLTIINCGDSDVVLPLGYRMWERNNVDFLASDIKVAVRSDVDLALVFLLWNNRAHIMVGWNSTKFDNIQLLRAVADNSRIRHHVDHCGEFKKLDAAGHEAGSFMSRNRFRFAWKHQVTIEGLQMAILYKMLKSNQKSLAKAAVAMRAGVKMDVSMREMELHWRNWRNGKCELNSMFVDYCMNDSMIVYNMFRDIHTEMIFAENVASNLEQLNLCFSRLPYCEPLFHRRMAEIRQVYDARIRLYGNMYPMYSQVHCSDYINGFEKSKEKKKYPGAIVSKPVAGLHRNVAAVDFASLYPNNERQYSLSDGTAWPLPRELADKLDDAMYHKIELTLGKYTVWMCSLKDDKREKQGCLSSYMSYCLDYRAEIKKLQAKEVKGSDKWIQLEAGQLTVKRAANGQYGITGMAQYNSEVNSNFACAIAYAASITAIGRKFLRAAQLVAVEMGLRPLYSDTDSIYVETEMDCNKLASIINSELCEMYHTNDFSRNGIIERKTLGTPSVRTPIVLKLAGEANYLWMTQVYKKRYICIYPWESFCNYCNIKHPGILFKGGPSSDLMEFAHKTILTAHEKFLAGENVQEYLSNVLRETLAGSQPTWRSQNAQPLDMYTKSTPAIHVRHANAISTVMGNSTSEIEFCSIYPERYYTGKVPKSFNDASYPCTPVELEKIYRGRALQLDVASMTFLTDMKRAAKINDEQREIEIEVDDDGDDDDDDDKVNKSELQYEMADVRNEHIQSLVKMTVADIRKWMLAANRRGVQATMHMLPEKLMSKKRNFGQLFFFGLVMPRIHSHMRVNGLETARYTMHGDCRRLEGATIDAGINIGSLVKASEVQIIVECDDVATEIFLATELLGFKLPKPQIVENEINVIETLWGWYLVHNGVHFFPYSMALLDFIKRITF